MPAYLIIHFTIKNLDGFTRYASQAGPLAESYGARLLAMEDDPVVVEGGYEAGRTMLVAFPSQEVLDAWYESDENQELSHLRQEFTVTHSMVTLSGFVPPNSPPASGGSVTI